MPHDAEIQTRPEPAPVPARPCATGCGAWADVAVGGLAICRDCAEAFARAYGILSREDEDDRGLLRSLRALRQARAVYRREL